MRKLLLLAIFIGLFTVQVYADTVNLDADGVINAAEWENTTNVFASDDSRSSGFDDSGQAQWTIEDSASVGTISKVEVKVEWRVQNGTSAREMNLLVRNDDDANWTEYGDGTLVCDHDVDATDTIDVTAHDGSWTWTNIDNLDVALESQDMNATDEAQVDHIYIVVTFNGAESPTHTLTCTITPTHTISPTHTQTYSVTPTYTNTNTDTYSITPTHTHTYSISPTHTNTATHTDTATNTYTNTYTDTHTATNTHTNTYTHTHTATITPAPFMDLNPYGGPRYNY